MQLVAYQSNKLYSTVYRERGCLLSAHCWHWISAISEYATEQMASGDIGELSASFYLVLTYLDLGV